MQRLDRPYIRENGRLRPATWIEAFAAIAARVKGAGPKRIGVIAGDLAAVEEMFALKLLAAKLGVVNIDGRQDGTTLDPAYGRALLHLQHHRRGDRGSRRDAAGWLQSAQGSVGSQRPHPQALADGQSAGRRHRRAGGPDLSHYEYLGAGADTLAETRGRHARIRRDAEERQEAADHRRGRALSPAPDGLAILSLAAKAALAVGAVKDGWNGFTILHTAAARVGALDLGLRTGRGRPDAACHG